MPAPALAPVARAFRLHPKYPYLWPAFRSLPRSFHALRGIFMPEERPPLAGRLLEEDVAFMAAALRRIPTMWQRVQWLEMVWYLRSRLLRDADWAGMAHSVEIRTPLVDWTLYTTLMGYELNKFHLLRAAGTATQRSPRQPKRGFETPVYTWMAHQPKADRTTGYRQWVERIVSAAK
jgi:asparagine synthase (glutamine-hydrolysing)